MNAKNSRKNGKYWGKKLAIGDNRCSVTFYVFLLTFFMLLSMTHLK